MSTKGKDARLHIRLSTSDKEKILRLANKCNLSTSEYVVQRALGFVPVVVQPDALYNLNDNLTELLNRELTPEVESVALELFDRIHKALFEVRKEDTTGPPESKRLFGEKEHHHSDEPFDIYVESDKRRLV